MTKTSGSAKATIENEINDFYSEINQSKGTTPLSNPLQIEELITPMVYRNLTMVSVGDFQDKIRSIIEKACIVFKHSMCNSTTQVETVKRFFQTTHDFLREKVGEQYAKNKLGREIDLEWQSLMAEIGLKGDEVDEISRMLS